MRCPDCSAGTIRWGKDRNGRQRYRCRACGRTVTDVPDNPIAPMRIPFERAVLCLSLLSEGASIRATERITGTHRDTICRLLVLAGGKCARLLEERVRNAEVQDVQVAEVRAFVGVTAATGNQEGRREREVGAWQTRWALEPSSKLIVAASTVRPSADDPRRPIAHDSAGDRERTRHAERLTLDVRTRCRRFGRRTTGFSRKLAHHRAATALFAAVHNFVTMHSSLRMTPAMRAGIARRPWNVTDLLTA